MAREDLASQFLLQDMPKEWWGRDFRNIIETHLPTLRVQGSTIHTITDSEGYHHTGDLYSLLTARNVISKYHWIVMRVNKFYSTLEYDGKAFDLIIPNEDAINMIWDLYRTTANVD